MASKDLIDYELMIILKPLLPDDVRKSIHKDILSMVKDFGGQTDDVDVWGKRYLAYKIAGHNEGYYIVYTLKLQSKDLAEMRRKMDLQQDILRYLIVKQEGSSKKKKKIKKKEIEVEV